MPCNGDDHIFRIQGCDITATIAGGNVSALRLELTDTCQADLTTFIGDYAPPPGRTLTAGAVHWNADLGCIFGKNKFGKLFCKL